MTKKDYIAIANVIKDSKKSLSYASVNMGELNRVIDLITINLSTIFQIDNNNFDKNRFFEYIKDETKRFKDFTDK